MRICNVANFVGESMLFIIMEPGLWIHYYPNRVHVTGVATVQYSVRI